MGAYVLDFYCDSARLNVEIDGQTHSLAGAPERDAKRDAWLETQGVRTLRLPATYVLKNLNDALETIRAALILPRRGRGTARRAVEGCSPERS